MWRSLVACLNGVQEAGGSNPLTPVSYTHLDVYKRQLQRHAQRKRQRAGEGHGAAFAAGEAESLSLIHIFP